MFLFMCMDCIRCVFFKRCIKYGFLIERSTVKHLYATIVGRIRRYTNQKRWPTITLIRTSNLEVIGLQKSS